MTFSDGPPRFDVLTPKGGYAWWYVDGLSEDGAHGLVVIAFIGSVFSPYYAWSKAQDPYDHVCVNVALYGRPSAWAMTERGRGALDVGAERFAVAGSSLQWREDGLDIHIDERRAPVPRRLRGTVRVRAPAFARTVHTLEEAGEHLWRPIMPAARMEAAFEAPNLSWTGSAYVDANFGAEPLGAGFRTWDWRRTTKADGRTEILYDAQSRRAGEKAMGLVYGPGGAYEPTAVPPRRDLTRGLWGVRRRVRSAGPARLIRPLEDAPFYTRSEVETTGADGAPERGVAESLDMDRFAKTWVRSLLPFRMPRLG